MTLSRLSNIRSILVPISSKRLNLEKRRDTVLSQYLTCLNCHRQYYDGVDSHDLLQPTVSFLHHVEDYNIHCLAVGHEVLMRCTVPAAL